MESKWTENEIWILTRTKRIQIHGRPQEDTIDEKDGMEAPRIALEGRTRHPERKPHFTYHLMSKMGNMIYYAI